MDIQQTTIPVEINSIQCPKCHQPVKPTDYFCANCGTNLKPVPLSTSIGNQIALYLKSALFPPLGFIWGYKYVREPQTKSKVIGLLAMAITITALIVIAATAVNLINTVNQQVNSELNQFAF